MSGGTMVTRLWCCSVRRRVDEAGWTLRKAAERECVRLTGTPEFFVERERRGNHIGPIRHFARQRYIREAA